jgi:hypothetical protein
MPGAVYEGGKEYRLPEAQAAEFAREGVAQQIAPAARRKSAAISSALSPESRWQAKVSSGDTLDWQVNVRLPLLSALRIWTHYLPPHERAVRSQRPRRKSRSLEEVGGFGQGPDRRQASALDYLVAHEERIRDRALAALAIDALRTYRRDWVKNAGEDVANRIVPEQMTATDAAKRVEVSFVVVTREAIGTMAYIELHGECVWDRGHGFVVVLHRDRVVEVCQQGTGWIDPKRARRKRG